MDGVQYILVMGFEYCILFVGKIKRFCKNLINHISTALCHHHIDILVQTQFPRV